MPAQATPFVVYAPWLVILPSLAVVLLILGFNLFGDAVRDVLAPGVNRSRAGASA